MRIQLSLHARSHPPADWHSQLTAMHDLRLEEQTQALCLRCRGVPTPLEAQEQGGKVHGCRGMLAPARALRAAQVAHR